MNDLNQQTIKKLFYQQIRDLTSKSLDSFDYQFSDRWMR